MVDKAELSVVRSPDTEGPAAQVVAPDTLNLNVFIQGYWDGTSAMLPVLANQGQSNSTTDCDSITVELHETSAPFGLLHSTVAVLHTDGTASVVFSSSVTPGNYYIVIKHRNSLETWSANPVLLGTNAVYDFTTSANKAYGDNQIQLENNVFGVYNGNINQDGSIDIFDFLEWDTDNQNFTSGYYSTDINGDGNVDIFDFLIWDPNNQNFIGVITP